MIVEVDGEGVVVVTVRARPGAHGTGVTGEHDGALKVSVQAPADRGRANDALVAFLADRFGRPRRDVELVGGATSRSKRFRIHGITAAQARAVVGDLLERA